MMLGSDVSPIEIVPFFRGHSFVFWEVYITTVDETSKKNTRPGHQNVMMERNIWWFHHEGFQLLLLIDGNPKSGEKSS